MNHNVRMDRVNVLIIGGGVVGCAVAMECAALCDDVFLLEVLPKLGMGASTRNSGVIHSGLYYPAGSKKAMHCVEGNRLTYEFCAAHSVPHRRTGKLVVAVNAAEECELDSLVKKGEANGVENLRLLTRAEIKAREPHIEGVAAIEVPSTGIVVSEDLVKTCARIAAERGANILTDARVTALNPVPNGLTVTMQREGEAPERIEARCVVNAAGLYADEVAALLGTNKWRIHPVRGEYAEVTRAKSHLVNALVYPLPHPEGLSLGVHFTKTLWGAVLIGPTARYVARKDDYESARDTADEFVRRAKSMLPEIEPADLTLAYTGIRAKLVPLGAKGPADFVIERDTHTPRAIHLVGIESPGLTAALSLAREVRVLVQQTLA